MLPGEAGNPCLTLRQVAGTTRILKGPARRVSISELLADPPNLVSFKKLYEKDLLAGGLFHLIKQCRLFGS